MGDLLLNLKKLRRVMRKSTCIIFVLMIDNFKIMNHVLTTDEHFQLAVYLSYLFQKCSLFMKLGSEYCDRQYSKYSVCHQQKSDDCMPTGELLNLTLYLI